MNHDNDGGGDNSVRNYIMIEILMMLVSLMVKMMIMTIMNRWRKKGQRCNSKQKKSRQR